MDDFDRVDRAFDDVIEQSSVVTAGELSDLAHLVTNIIVLRTKKGIDADGKPFAPYSKEYLAIRRKRGLSSLPDLAVKGHMLGAIVPQIDNGSASLRFASAQENIKALSHDDPQRHGRPKREFFDVRLPAELQLVADQLGGALVSRIEKAVR